MKNLRQRLSRFLATAILSFGLVSVANAWGSYLFWANTQFHLQCPGSTPDPSCACNFWSWMLNDLAEAGWDDAYAYYHSATFETWCSQPENFSACAVWLEEHMPYIELIDYSLSRCVLYCNY